MQHRWLDRWANNTFHSKWNVLWLSMAKIRSTTRFIQLYESWLAVTPPDLATENPCVLIRLLDLGSQEHTSQTALRAVLQVGQSRLSKLMNRLQRKGWVSIHRSGNDGRVRFMTTTSKGKAFLSDVESSLAKAGKAQLLTAPQEENELVALTFNFHETGEQED